MQVEQYVMAYKVEQDRLRAMLPENFESLRPVLRINAEIRKTNAAEFEDHNGKTSDDSIYIEVNTPVAASEKRGWLNIANWETPQTDIIYQRDGSAVTFTTPFLEITYTGVGVEGSCPAENDNDGCFFLEDNVVFRPYEKISSNREFCDCEFKWKFENGDAHGISVGDKSVPAFPTKQQIFYEKQELSAASAAKIRCEQILGSYCVKFQR